MISTTMSDFRREMKQYLDRVIDDIETLVINRGKDRGVVVISMDEYNSMLATMHELSSRANEQWLDKSLESFEKGRFSEKELIDP